MMKIISIICFIATIVYLQGYQLYGGKKLESSLGSAVQYIEKDISYGQITPFIDEWNLFFKDLKEKRDLSPIQMWFRCLGRQVRGYLFIEPLEELHHIKETFLRSSGYIGRNLKITAAGEPVYLRAWNGGIDFFFNISANTTDKYIDIKIVGFKHYTRFPVSKCVTPTVISPTRKYIMHIHLKDFIDAKEFEPAIIDGIAHHMAYHRCALKLDKYEVVIQREHLPLYIRNPKIAHAVKQGWITFIIRNPVMPSPVIITNHSSNCYYQAYTQNLALLQHWQENVKIYFFDSDEYLNVGDNVNGKELIDLVESHTAIGFMRRMIFCDSCPEYEPEARHWSLTKSILSLNDHKLRDPKLVVDPSSVGCYIVHWAGCGDKTLRLPVEKVMILHFENMYHVRWHKLSENAEKIVNGLELRPRLSYGNETVFRPSSLVNTCDPINYDWKSSLPSFHFQ